MEIQNKNYGTPLTVALFVLLGVFAAAIILGNSLVLADNWVCNALGCNYGFFGYDTVVQHFLAGILGVIILVWFMRAYPRLNILQPSFLKNLLVTLAIVGLVGICWEFFEFIQDLVRIKLFNLAGSDDAIRNYLAQPNSADTIGDLVFDVVGGLIGLFILKITKQI